MLPLLTLVELAFKYKDVLQEENWSNNYRNNKSKNVAVVEMEDCESGEEDNNIEEINVAELINTRPYTYKALHKDNFSAPKDTREKNSGKITT